MLVNSTIHRGLVELVPAEPGAVGMYVCGATVQSEPHVGHGRYAVVFDMIRRYLVWKGYRVNYVRNITDIDDKIIVAAASAGEDVAARAARIAVIFADSYRALGVGDPDHEPKATEHIPEMLDLIGLLINRGLAYPARNGDVYFAVRTLESSESSRVAAPTNSSLEHGSRSPRRRTTRWTSPSGRRPSPGSRLGTPRGARAGRVGTSSARRWPSDISARISPSMGAVTISSSLIMRMKSPNPKAPPGRRLPGSGCTTEC